MKNFCLRFVLIIIFCSYSLAQVSLTGVGTYTQDFNTLANAGTSSNVPTGWAFAESGTSVNNDGLYTASTGSSTAGDTYSFGSAGSSERAFGELTSGTLSSIIGCQFINQTGLNISQIPITYFGEQWRLGAIGRIDKLDFQYSTDATSLTTGAWTNVDNLDFVAPVTSGTVGLLDGNLSANRTNILFTITGLNISNGSTFWIRWISTDASGSDDGLSIDDFSIDETTLPVELSSFSAIVLDKGVKLNWRTETEVNNYGFEILRAHTSNPLSLTEWDVLGFVQGNGNSNSPKEYSFTDDLTLTPNLNPTVCYRLKQIDTDGKFEYSKVIEVNLGTPRKFELSQNYPNPFNPSTTIEFVLAETQKAELKVFDVLGNEVATVFNGIADAGKIYESVFNAENLSSGIYFYRLESVNKVENRKMVLLK